LPVDVPPLTALPDVPLVPAPGAVPGAPDEDDEDDEDGADEVSVELGELLLGMDVVPEAEPLTLPLVPALVPGVVVSVVEALLLGVVGLPGDVVTVVLLGVVVVLEVVPFAARLRSQPVAAAEARMTTATTGMRRFMKSPVQSCRCRKRAQASDTHKACHRHPAGDTRRA
jgi:hypothetical protein